jgi:amino acid adenylation domain-containing protein
MKQENLKKSYPPIPGYVDLFTPLAARLSHKAAVILNEQTITYGELARASDIVAEALMKKGGIRGKIVPLLFPRIPNVFAAILGVWKAGGAVCVIDLAFPQERIEDMTAQCGAGFIMDPPWFKDLDPYNRSPSPEFKALDPEAEQLAMVVFTSGSTGHAKGVMLPHRAVAVSAKETAEKIFQEEDRHLNIIGFSFVLLVTDGFGALLAGATLHIAPDNIRADPALIVRYMVEHKITTGFLTPQAASAFLEKMDGQLRLLATGSEKVGKFWGEKTALVTAYGASETASAIFWFYIDCEYDVVPSGKPNEGTKVYLVDPDGNLAAEGESGELYVSGAQVALGYLGSPELSAETFLPNPFSDDPLHKTLYRTHDIFRKNEDGNYIFVERADWMIKVRGYRVEPTEIEAAMRKAAPITHAVVIGFESRAENDRGKHTRLYACYTAPERIDPAFIKEEISKVLPAYMIPAFIEQLPSLPLNANGKIDRRKIAPPEIERFKVEYEEPVGETEKIICKAFGKVLGFSQVGALDDFGLLGGDSLSAARVLSLLPESLGINVMDLLFSCRTPRALAAAADQKENLPEAAPEDDAPQDAPELTPYQKIFYYEWLLDRNRWDYNIVDERAFSREDPWEFPVEKMNHTLHRLVKSSFILSSVVSPEDGTLRWKAREPLPTDFRLLTYIDHPLTDVEIFPLISKPFDLEKDLPVRYFLIKISEKSYRFIFVTHHIVMDGTKANWAYGEINRCWEGLDKTEHEKQKLFQQRLNRKWQAILEKYGEEIASFWDNRLKGAALDLNFLLSGGIPETELPALPVSMFRFFIEKKEFDRVRIIARKYGITPYIYGQIVFAVILSKMTGQRRVSFAFPVMIPEGADYIWGARINTLIVDYRISPDADFTDLAEQARSYFRDIESSRAKYLPVNEITRRLENRDVLEIFFTQTNLRDTKLGFAGAEEESGSSLILDMNSKLAFEQEEQDQRLGFRVRYKNRQLDRGLVEHFAEMYRNLFIDMANDLFKEEWDPQSN